MFTSTLVIGRVAEKARLALFTVVTVCIVQTVQTVSGRLVTTVRIV